MPRPSDRAATARFKPRFKAPSANRTTPQVDQATHTEAFADFAQLRAAGREESAQQPIPAKLLDLNLPTLGATAQALENPASSAGISGTPNRLLTERNSEFRN
jgi:hypothetical protein